MRERTAGMNAMRLKGHVHGAEVADIAVLKCLVGRT